MSTKKKKTVKNSSGSSENNPQTESELNTKITELESKAEEVNADFDEVQNHSPIARLLRRMAIANISGQIAQANKRISFLSFIGGPIIMMALIKYSALVSGMSGKLNGSVAARNRYGSYLRNKTTPVNAQTSFQQIQRAFLASLSSSWQTISQAQREAWGRFAEDHPITNQFGDTVTLSGQVQYVSCNQNRLNMGLPILSDPIQASPTDIILDLTAQVGVLDDFRPDALPTPLVNGAFLYATPPVSPGLNFGSIKNRYRLLEYLSPGTVFPHNSSVPYGARFGSLAGALGQKVFFKIVPVDQASGLAGMPFSAFEFVTP
jgi:hypothetical protein